MRCTLKVSTFVKSELPEDGLLLLKIERARGKFLDVKSDFATTIVGKCLYSFILPQLRKVRHYAAGSVDASSHTISRFIVASSFVST